MPLLDIFSKTKKINKEEKITIIVDNREKNSLVASELIKLGFNVEFRQLPVADYLVKNVAVERKTISDLKSSIISKRIISQLLEIKQYPLGILIVEGINNEDIYSIGLHENALRGFLLSVVFEYNVPIIFTQDARDTAKYISVLAKKEKKSDLSVRASKIFKTKTERQQFILEGFPNIGPRAAQKLLDKFGSLRNIFSASEEELIDVLGKRSKDFRELLG